MEEEVKNTEEMNSSANEERIEKSVEVKEEAKEEAPPRKKVKEKRKKIDKEKDELIKANLDLKEKVLRITAEMQNIKRRSEIDLANAYKYDGFDLMEKILPILDNFERALSIKQEGTEKFLEGFKMIYDNLRNILLSKGVTEIECIHKEFDPNMMNAVMTDTNNDFANNIVLDCLQKGYMYQDKILRPAMVKVNERDITQENNERNDEE